MRLYEIYYPELAVDVRFKVLDLEEIEAFLQKVERSQTVEFKLKVIDHLVYNLYTGVSESLHLMSTRAAESCLLSLYQGCVMLNPALDPVLWTSLSNMQSGKKADEDTQDADFIFDLDYIDSKVELTTGEDEEGEYVKKRSPGSITKTKVKTLRPFLRANLIGQDEAVSAIYNALLISQAGLKEKNSPVGVFLFAGASGVGKTLAAKLVQKHLFGDLSIVRLDCGEFQHKHENQKLLGSPPGYVGHDDGSPIFNQVNNNPDTVILLDEVEKAHPDFWNTFLHIFDEGYAVDNQGMEVDFSHTIIIMTTNLGNDKTADMQQAKAVGFSSRARVNPSREFVEETTHEAIREFFKPEFINRIHETVVFNHLTNKDLLKIAELELQKLQDMLAKRGIELVWDEAAIEALALKSQNNVKGARDITSTRVKMLDRVMAKMIVDNKVKRGYTVQIGPDLEVSTGG